MLRICQATLAIATTKACQRVAVPKRGRQDIAQNLPNLFRPPSFKSQFNMYLCRCWLRIVSLKGNPVACLPIGRESGTVPAAVSL
jgi:hypothetical protein